MTKLLNVFKTMIAGIPNMLQDRTQTLEQYIVANNPQTANHVEQLERQYYARQLRGKMI
jgi:hypothetical protein